MKKTLLILLSLLAPLALLAQTSRIPGPAGEFLGTPPVINTSVSSDSGVTGASTATLNFTAPSGTFGIVAHVNGAAPNTFSSAFDCAGAGPCTTPGTDQLNLSGPCVNTTYFACELYVCQSRLASGASSITITVGSSAGQYVVEVEVITGEAVSGCMDQFASSNNAGSANPSITTAANIQGYPELLIGAMRAATTLTAGSGFSNIQSIGSGPRFLSEKRTQPPAHGATATASWTATSGGWAGTVSSWSPGFISQPPQLDNSCLTTGTTTQIHCSIPNYLAGEALVLHLYMATTATFGSIQDCTGSSACSGSTDTLAASFACATINARQLCEYYICTSALSSGAVDFTFNTTGSGTRYVEAETYQGMKTSGCSDTTGSNFNAASANPTSTTSGNIATGTELLLGFAASGTAPSATSTTQKIQLNGGFITVRSLSAPTAGSPATIGVTSSSSSWAMMNSAWKSR
jgi:hypothetical protein